MQPSACPSEPSGERGYHLARQPQNRHAQGLRHQHQLPDHEGPHATYKPVESCLGAEEEIEGSRYWQRTRQQGGWGSGKRQGLGRYAGPTGTVRGRRGVVCPLSGLRYRRDSPRARQDSMTRTDNPRARLLCIPDAVTRSTPTAAVSSESPRKLEIRSALKPHGGGEGGGATQGREAPYPPTSDRRDVARRVQAARTIGSKMATSSPPTLYLCAHEHRCARPPGQSELPVE